MIACFAWAALAFVLIGVILFNAYGYGQRSSPANSPPHATALGWLEFAIFAWMLVAGVFVTLGIGVWNAAVTAAGLGGRAIR